MGSGHRFAGTHFVQVDSEAIEKVLRRDWSLDDISAAYGCDSNEAQALVEEYIRGEQAREHARFLAFLPPHKKIIVQVESGQRSARNGAINGDGR